MIFGVVSDIHLEFTRLDRSALESYKGIVDVLCICGDLCPAVKFERFDNFIRMCSEIFPKTVLVSGNHEYYGTSIVEGDRLIRMICSSYENVHYLNKDKVEVFPGIMIYGCTLWTNIPDDRHVDIYRAMNDYKSIKYLTPKTVSTIHKHHVDWLSRCLSSDTGTKIVMTHHLPLRGLLSKGFNMEIADAYATNIVLPRMPDIWLAGHVHTHVDVSVGETRYMINARGYRPSEHDDQNLVYMFMAGP